MPIDSVDRCANIDVGQARHVPPVKPVKGLHDSLGCSGQSRPPRSLGKRRLILTSLRSVGVNITSTGQDRSAARVCCTCEDIDNAARHGGYQYRVARCNGRIAEGHMPTQQEENTFQEALAITDEEQDWMYENITFEKLEQLFMPHLGPA